MRFFVSLLIALGLIVLVFVLILKSFSGHSSPTLPKPLTSYDNTSAVMQVIIDGPITVDQTRQEVQISVDQTQTEIQIMQGYQGTVVNSKTYPNNTSSYLYFLSALNLAGFTNGTSNSVPVSTLGYCPFGNRYTYQIINDAATIQNYWSDSCKDGSATFKGNNATVQDLFENQIPDFSDLTNNLDIFANSSIL